jgi:hypothetical protein
MPSSSAKADDLANTHCCRHPRKRVIQYSSALVMESKSCGVLDTPLSRGMTVVYAVRREIELSRNPQIF